MSTNFRSTSWIRAASAALNILSAIVFLLWICLPKGTPYIGVLVYVTWGWVILSLLGLPEEFRKAIATARAETPDPRLESWQDWARRLKPVAEATWVFAFIVWLVAPKHSLAANLFLGLATVWAMLVPALVGVDGHKVGQRPERTPDSDQKPA